MATIVSFQTLSFNSFGISGHFPSSFEFSLFFKHERKCCMERMTHCVISGGSVLITETVRTYNNVIRNVLPYIFTLI